MVAGSIIKMRRLTNYDYGVERGADDGVKTTTITKGHPPAQLTSRSTKQSITASFSQRTDDEIMVQKQMLQARQYQCSQLLQAKEVKNPNTHENHEISKCSGTGLKTDVEILLSNLTLPALSYERTGPLRTTTRNGQV